MAQNDQKNQEEIAQVEATKSPFDTFGVAIFLVVLVEILLLIGLNLYQKSRAQTIGNKISASQKTLASPEYTTLNTQLEEVLAGQKLLQTVLDSKVNWSQFYTMLNAVTPKNVKVNSIQLNVNGTFRLDGETQSMSSLAQALVVWQKGSTAAPTPFSSAKLSNNGFATKDGNRIVSFTISGSLNMGVLK
ncbi:MAG: hypothetical protein HZB70_00205 [Candidatus Berkelbacteria bacterium]|nr:MAG: hypothetical protein HZB70_00205 [Candidatus Berkelbacteria bacterium]QQG51470.1 MAG: hypothetical protein HY845_02795 [Candidatus Berkelbacteria bacterium]